MGCQPASACGIRTNEATFQEEKRTSFSTKYERLLYTLNKLKKKAEKYGDAASVKDLEW